MERDLFHLLEAAPISSFHYRLLIIGSLVYCFTGMNVMLVAAVLTPIINEFKLKAFESGLLVSVGYLGMFCGALACGILADSIGRKKTLLFTTLIMTIFTAANAIAPNALAMSLLRFLAGVGLGGSLPQPGVYVSEYIPAKYRGRFLGIIEASWVYGALLSLLFPYILFPMFGWRLTFLAALTPLALILLIVFLMPESLRYLLLKGKTEETLEFLVKQGLVRERVDEEKLAIKLHERYRVTVALRELWSATYRRRTILLWILWAVLVYTYHGIFIWLPTIYVKELGFTVVKSIEWTIIVTLAQVPGYYSAAFLLDRVGRKSVATSYLTIAGVGSILLSQASAPEPILLWSIIISFFNLGAWSALYAYTPELYPTRIRGTGAGAAASIGRVAGAIAPALTPLLYMYGGLAAPFTVFAITHLLGALATAALGIETKGKALEEIAK
ncbi:MAG: MFS transporter [Candidatus Bathyarchaeia archaeon]